MKNSYMKVEICKELNFWERILFRVFRKTFVNTFKAGVKIGFNWRKEHT